MFCLCYSMLKMTLVIGIHKIDVIICKKNHGVVDLLLECYPNECHNYCFKMIVRVLWISFLKTTIICHRNSDLNVDSIRVTGENEISDFISDFKIKTLKNAPNIVLGQANINGVRNKFGPIEGIFINGLIDKRWFFSNGAIWCEKLYAA